MDLYHPEIRRAAYQEGAPPGWERVIIDDAGTIVLRRIRECHACAKADSDADPVRPYADGWCMCLLCEDCQRGAEVDGCPCGEHAGVDELFDVDTDVEVDEATDDARNVARRLF